MSDLWRRGLEYARRVRSGRKLVNHYARRACLRHFNDLAKSKAGKLPYHFDTARANRALRWMELMPHVKGRWARGGERLRLEGWQCFVIGSMMGWVNSDGHRRFRVAYIEIPRKNGKSLMLSGLSLYFLLHDDEPGADVFSAGVDRGQAEVVFDAAKAMVEKSPGLREKFEVEVTGGLTQSGKIHAPMQHSRMVPLSKERGGNLDGLNIHFVSCDELHAWPGRKMYDVLMSGMGSREQPMLATITTAGYNQASVCYEQSGYVKRILDGKEKNDEYFGIVYCADADDPWDAVKTWRKCNPNLGVSKDIKSLNMECRIARANSAAQSEFKRKHICRWTSNTTAWIAPEVFAKCAGQVDLEELKSYPCYIGIDLASKRDLCAVVLLFDCGEEWVAKPYFHLPQDTIDAGANAPVYQGWVKDGWLVAHPGARIDFGLIEAQVAGMCDGYQVGKVGADPHHAAYMLKNLEDQIDAEIGIVETLTTPISLTFGAKEFDGLVADGKFKYDGNPILAWCVDNTYIRTDDKGNWFPTKEDRNDVGKKIDGSIALINALTMGLSSRHEEEEGFGVQILDWDAL